MAVVEVSQEVVADAGVVHQPERFVRVCESVRECERVCERV